MAKNYLSGLEFVSTSFAVSRQFSFARFFRRKLQAELFLDGEYQVQMLDRVPVIEGLRRRRGAD